MSEEKNLEEIKKFWPKDAPDVKNVPKYVKKYKKDNSNIELTNVFLYFILPKYSNCSNIFLIISNY